MIKVFLNRGEEADILRGTPLVYDNEISHLKFQNSFGKWEAVSDPLSFECEAGQIAEVYSKSGLLLGSGLINQKSKIMVRLLSRKSIKDMGDPKEFIRKKIIRAAELRKKLFGDESFRAFFSESDGLSGFVCDKFTDLNKKTFLVCQFSSLACEVYRDTIIETLKRCFSPVAIYERCDEHIRQLEGLESHEGYLYKSRDFLDEDLIIDDSGVKYSLDLKAGQKTGHFLDQRDNRVLVRKYSKGARVMDPFCHTGGFALNAFFGGAKSVLASDISSDAIEIVKKNISLNGAGNVIKTRVADAFQLLRTLESEGERFDVIILDPPAFTKSATNIDKAFGGYKEINLRAMKILRDGGFLITSSCSHFFDETLFNNMLGEAAKDAHKKVQILSKTGAALDHPVLLGYDKSRYLKCFVAAVYDIE